MKGSLPEWALCRLLSVGRMLWDICPKLFGEKGYTILAIAVFYGLIALSRFVMCQAEFLIDYPAFRLFSKWFLLMGGIPAAIIVLAVVLTIRVIKQEVKEEDDDVNIVLARKVAIQS